jgi:dihydroorotate dehydrogenase (fumarate)
MTFKFGDFLLDSPIGIGAGVVKKDDKHFDEALRCPVSVITVGSITTDPRPGNSGDVWAPPLNSLGMPNPGIEYFKTHGKTMVQKARDAGKILGASVAGFSPKETVELAYQMHEYGFDFTEGNLGCPNLWGPDGQKPIPSFNPGAFQETLSLYGELLDGEMYGVKLSPYTDVQLLEIMAIDLRDCGVNVGFLTTSNTMPNCFLMKPDGKPYISFGKGLAGGSGPGLKPLAMGNLLQFREILKDTQILSIAAGGVESGQDVVDYLSLGASLVNVVTAYAAHGDPNVLSRIAIEFANLAIAA